MSNLERIKPHDLRSSPRRSKARPGLDQSIRTVPSSPHSLLKAGTGLATDDPHGIGMIISSVTLSSGVWLWPVVAGLLLAVTLVLWSYHRSPIPRKWLCAGLKILGLALLGWCVLDPQWSQERARPGANLMVVLADNSRSLLVTDEGASRPRAEDLRQVLDPSTGTWQRTLEDSFELRRYQFDRRLQPVEHFAELTFQGQASAIGSALELTRRRFEGRPLAGMILLTDGIATDLPSLPTDLSGWPPIYPVVIGGQGPARDLSVRKVSVTQTAFEDAPVTVEAEVGLTGYSGGSLLARLTDRAGKTVEEQTRPIASGGTVAAFRFQVRDAPPGISFYQFSVREAGENGEATQEATLANNRRVLVVDRAQGPYRILYVSGRPNWEFKFLNRALESDDQVQLTGLIRVAKREAKFSFLGRAGESSNPLFRGTEDQAQGEVAAYDQPVLVRLNPADDQELRSGFPVLPETLFSWDAVILDDVESAFFTPTQSTLLQRFVSERGGGLLMLGGMESFAEGGYARTPIGEALPVHLDRVGSAAAPGPLTFQLDREGWLQVWARLRENESDELARLSGMPPLLVLNRVRGVKAGAGVIATANDSAGNKAPALAVHRFGRGRSAALMLGDLWRWGMRSPEARTDLEKSWRQLVRWLVADVPGRVALTVDPKPADPNGAMLLQVRVSDAKFQPVENATVNIVVEPMTFGQEGTPAEEKTLTLQAEPSPDEPGLYLASWVPRQTGGFKATAKASNANGAEEGRATAGWATDLEAQELRSLTPDISLMEALARKTGGAVVTVSGLDELAARLPSVKAPVMEAHEAPLWHTPWIFLAALGCLAAEWGLRRTSGLP